MSYAKRWIWLWAGESYDQVVAALSLSFVSEFPQSMASSRQTWPITKPNSCLTTRVGQLDLPDLPDRPYHPDAKVTFPKRAFGVIMITILWPRYQVCRLYFSTQILPPYCTWSCDAMRRTTIFQSDHINLWRQRWDGSFMVYGVATIHAKIVVNVHGFNPLSATGD